MPTDTAYSNGIEGSPTSATTDAGQSSVPRSDSLSRQDTVMGIAFAGTLLIWVLSGMFAFFGTTTSTPPTHIAAPELLSKVQDPEGELRTSSPPADSANAVMLSLHLSSAESAPSIIVLPFANLSQNPAEEYLADGITRLLTAKLAQTAELDVIAPSTAFTYKGTVPDLQQLGRDLAVRYVLLGGARRDEDILRIEAQLVATDTGARLWVDAFEVGQANFREISGRILKGTWTTLNLNRPTSDAEADHQEHPRAQELTMMGWFWHDRSPSKFNSQRARQVFEKALEIDPDSVAARIGLATILGGRPGAGWTIIHGADPKRAEQLVKEALDRDPEAPAAHFARGILRQGQNRLEDARTEYERAIALNTNYADALQQLGVTTLLLGYPELAISHFEKAGRLDPHNPNMAVRYWGSGASHLLMGHVDKAIEYLERAQTSNSRLWLADFYLAGALGLKGDITGGRSALAEASRRKLPVRSFSRMRSQKLLTNNSRHWALMQNTLNVGLRRVGFPER